MSSTYRLLLWRARGGLTTDEAPAAAEAQRSGGAGALEDGALAEDARELIAGLAVSFPQARASQEGARIEVALPSGEAWEAMEWLVEWAGARGLLAYDPAESLLLWPSERPFLSEPWLETSEGSLYVAPQLAFGRRLLEALQKTAKATPEEAAFIVAGVPAGDRLQILCTAEREWIVERESGGQTSLCATELDLDGVDRALRDFLGGGEAWRALKWKRPPRG